MAKMAKIIVLFLALVAAFQALPLDDERTELAELAELDALYSDDPTDLVFADDDFLTLKEFFNIRDWDAIADRAARSQAKKYVDEKVKVYYSIDPQRAMADLAAVGSLLRLAYSGSKGFKCSTPILEVMSTYQDLVKDSLIVSSTFVEIVIKALKYHKYAIMFANKGKNEFSIKYLRKCSVMASRMAEESQVLIDKADKLTGLAVDALLEANTDYTGTVVERHRIEELINATREEQAKQESMKHDISKRIAAEQKKERENAALASESSGVGIFVKILTLGIIDLDGPKQAEAKRAAEQARKDRIEFQREEQKNNADLAGSVQKLINSVGNKNNLEKSILGLDITIKTMGKIKTIFLNAKTFWIGIKKHVESLAASQEELEDLASDADFHEEYVDEVGLSGYSWLAIGKICRESALAIIDVNTGIDATMRNIPTEAEAKALIGTLGAKILKDLKDEAAEIQAELDSKKNQPTTT